MLSITEKKQLVKLSINRFDLATSQSHIIFKRFDNSSDLIKLFHWHVNMLCNEGSKAFGKMSKLLLTISHISMRLFLITNIPCQCFGNLYLLSLIPMTNFTIM